MPLLELREVSVRFGSLAALTNLSLDVKRGEILGIVGPNGSGKSTMLNAISGFYALSSGSVWFDGARISDLRPEAIAQRGLIRIFQSNVLFGEQTVLDNVVIGSYLTHRTSNVAAFFGTARYRAEERSMLQRAEAVLEQWGLMDYRDANANSLPHGFQRRLAVAVASADQPRMLLLDEPVAGLGEDEIESLMKGVLALRDAGTTVLLIEHHVKTVTSVCDRIVAINFGTKLAEGKPAEVVAHPAVVEAYIGAGGDDA
jgi:ABC-type branched-subunit amino acid transport system ATPase component